MKNKDTKRGKYDDKLKVKEGTTFVDIIKASVNDAKTKPKNKG